MLLISNRGFSLLPNSSLFCGKETVHTFLDINLLINLRHLTRLRKSTLLMSFGGSCHVPAGLNSWARKARLCRTSHAHLAGYLRYVILTGGWFSHGQKLWQLLVEVVWGVTAVHVVKAWKLPWTVCCRNRKNKIRNATLKWQARESFSDVLFHWSTANKSVPIAHFLRLKGRARGNGPVRSSWSPRRGRKTRQPGSQRQVALVTGLLLLRTQAPRTGVVLWSIVMCAIAPEHGCRNGIPLSLGKSLPSLYVQSADCDQVIWLFLAVLNCHLF